LDAEKDIDGILNEEDELLYQWDRKIPSLICCKTKKELFRSALEFIFIEREE